MTQPRPDRTTPAAGTNSEPAQAKQILEAALQQIHAVPDNSPDYALFLAAARKLGTQPFALSPVVEGLVSCALASTFPRTNWDTPGGQSLIQELSATLFSDPQSAARLNRLWDRLQRDM